MTWALTIIGLRWMSRSDNGPSPALAVVTGNVLALLLCLRWALPVGAPHASDWLVIMYLGVFQVGLAYACLTVALQHVAALEASLILLLEPVLNPVWVWLIQGERPGGWALLGGAIILLATGVKALLDASRDRDFAASGRPSRST